MDKSNATINIISFGFEPYTASVCDALAQLGNPVRSLSPQLWLGGESTHPCNITVLILTAHRSFHEKLHETIIRKISWSPHLAVFSYPITDGIQKILLCCQECCSWPCEQHELALRLERLSSLQNNLVTPMGDIINSGRWVELNLIGSSPTFRKALSIIEKSADCDVPVLIEGETGTGKEVAARAIHYLSARRDYPFIPVNCGAIPDNLIENELFGHEKGAYTDAKQTQSGLIAHAEGGTLFLDEIEALSVKGQVALLRFIEDKKIRPLGGKAYRKVNIRIVAAANASIVELVKKGQFRQDLWYRLMLLQLRLPPLRERNSDIQCLSEYFMQKFRAQYHQPNKRLHQNTLEWMYSYHWPGNVRELEHFIHRQFLLNEKPWVIEQNNAKQPSERRKLIDRRVNFKLDSPFIKAKHSVVSQFEKRYLIELLTRTKGNVTHAAQMAQKERRALGKLIKKHRIDPTHYHDRC
jgi:DNA-binding NtrC family response regulator